MRIQYKITHQRHIVTEKTAKGCHSHHGHHEVQCMWNLLEGRSVHMNASAREFQQILRISLENICCSWKGEKFLQRSRDHPIHSPWHHTAQYYVYIHISYITYRFSSTFTTEFRRIANSCLRWILWACERDEFVKAARRRTENVYLSFQRVISQ